MDHRRRCGAPAYHAACLYLPSPPRSLSLIGSLELVPANHASQAVVYDRVVQWGVLASDGLRAAQGNRGGGRVLINAWYGG